MFACFSVLSWKNEVGPKATPNENHTRVTQHTVANSAAFTSDSSQRVQFPTVQGSVSVRREKAVTRHWHCVGSENIWDTFFCGHEKTCCTCRRDQTRRGVFVNRLKPHPSVFETLRTWRVGGKKRIWFKSNAVKSNRFIFQKIFFSDFFLILSFNDSQSGAPVFIQTAHSLHFPCKVC